MTTDNAKITENADHFSKTIEENNPTVASASAEKSFKISLRHHTPSNQKREVPNKCKSYGVKGHTGKECK